MSKRKWIKFLLCYLFFNQSLFAMTSDQSIQLLREGNKRFREGKILHPRISEEARKKQITMQTPHCAILACSDSRVSPDLIFDQGIGELFIVRLAGNVASRSALESLDFASNILNVSLIVVIGHQNCGAVNAVFTHTGESDLGAISGLIAPAIQDAKNLKEAVLANVRRQMERVKSEPLLQKRLQNGSLQIIGAYYDFETQQVEFFNQ